MPKAAETLPTYPSTHPWLRHGLLRLLLLTHTQKPVVTGVDSSWTASAAQTEFRRRQAGSGAGFEQHSNACLRAPQS